MAENRNRFLIKNTIIFTIGNFGSKFISFFLIPLYTNKLTTDQYGIWDLIATIGTIAVPLLTLNIAESVMRFQLDKNARKLSISRIGLKVLLVGTFLGLIIIPICGLFSQISDYAILTYFYVISLMASQMMLCELRGKELLIQYAISNILYTLLIAGLNILFLVVLNGGTNGYLYAYILSNLVIAVYAFLVGKVYKCFTIKENDIELFKQMAKYSVVLIPNSFMWWIMNSSDRIMVTGMVSVAANGIYAISYKLPTLVNTVLQVFNQAWSYSAIREEGSEDESEYNNRIFRHLISLTMLAGIGIVCFSKPFLRIYINPDYFTAWKYIPFLTVGCVYITLGTFMATSYTVHKDSFGYLFSGLAGAVINIILNFLLIPQLKVYGAAIATCISYIVVFLFRLIHIRKYIRYSIKNFTFWFGTLQLIVASVLIYIDGIIPQIVLGVLFLVALSFYGKHWIPLIKKLLSSVRKGK